MGNADSRTLFREHIQQLVNEDLQEETQEFWKSLFTIEATIEDVFLMVPEEDVMRLLVDYRLNFVKLIDTCIQTMEESYNQVYNLDNQQLICTSNSIKIIFRIIPVTYAKDNSEEIWWESSRMHRIIKTCLGLLHAPVYSVYASLSTPKNDVIPLALLWKEGLLTKEPMVEASEKIWERRYELLLLLKTVIEEIKYKSTKSVHLIMKESWTQLTIYSILNTLIGFNPYGFLGLPYASYVISVNKQNCIKIGLQIISILAFLNTNQVPLKSQIKSNMVQNVLSGIKDRSELNLIWKSIKEILNTKFIAKNTYLPGSQKPCDLDEEILTFFNVMLIENKDFINVVVSTKSCIDILMPLFYILLQTPNSFICDLCLKIIRKLSENRKFCVLLNTNLNSCSLDLPLFTGNYADLLICGVTKLVFLKNDYLESKYTTMLIILCNFSCYIKSLSTVSSHNILKLLQEFSIKLLSNHLSSSQEDLGLILEIINNFIQYQWRASACLVYWILQNSSLFYKIQKVCKEHIKDFVEVIIILIQNLNELKSVSQFEFLGIMRRTTLVGILPVPHQISERQAAHNSDEILQDMLLAFYGI
jgi:High-temperature-induced dauer-formation protein